MAKLIDGFISKLDIDKFSIYLMDYGAPIGYRIFAKYPERVESLIVQNGNAYEEGLRDFWIPLKSYWEDPTSEKEETITGFSCSGWAEMAVYSWSSGYYKNKS